MIRGTLGTFLWIGNIIDGNRNNIYTWDNTNNQEIISKATKHQPIMLIYYNNLLVIVFHCSTMT